MVAEGRQASPAIGGFERYLTVWVLACIAIGTLLGTAWPHAFATLGGAEVAHVNLPVAALVWLMVVPMLLRIDWLAMRQIGRHGRGIGVTLAINWWVKPFSMAALA
jgi:ACR3 family arsenite transporter